MALGRVFHLLYFAREKLETTLENLETFKFLRSVFVQFWGLFLQENLSELSRNARLECTIKISLLFAHSFVVCSLQGGFVGKDTSLHRFSSYGDEENLKSFVPLS